MNDQEQKKEYHEDPKEGLGEKKPYQTPRLIKLGNVKELTEGTANISVPDGGVTST